jgi:four helix bundle protein
MTKGKWEMAKGGIGMTKGKVEMAKGGGGMTKGKVEVVKSGTERKGEMAKHELERSEDVMPVVCDRTSNRVYDLAGRTQCFGSAILVYAREVPVTPVTRPLITQLVRAGTSVGANYCEADGAASRKDFRHRIAICRREARETCYWLEMLATALPGVQRGSTELLREAKELNLIFSASMRTLSAPDR